MAMFEDLMRSLIVSFYGKKAESFNVSNSMIIGTNGNGGIQVLNLLKRSSSKEEFQYFVEQELFIDRNTDFYHFSLLFARYFGVYNLYGYFFIAPNVRQELLNSRPSVLQVFSLLEQNQRDFFDYFQEKYFFSEKFCHIFFNRMFSVQEDNFFYNRESVFDLGMILMGTQLYQQDFSTEKFPGCFSAMEYFQDKNHHLSLKKVK